MMSVMNKTLKKAVVTFQTLRRMLKICNMTSESSMARCLYVWRMATAFDTLNGYFPRSEYVPTTEYKTEFAMSALLRSTNAVLS